MVCPDATAKSHDILEGIESGFITLGDLQRCAIHLIRCIMKTPAFLKFVDGGCKMPSFTENDDADMEILETFSQIENGNEYSFSVDSDSAKICLIFDLSCSADAIAQLLIQVLDNEKNSMTVIINGTDGKAITEKRFMTVRKGENKLSFAFNDKVQINQVIVKK